MSEIAPQVLVLLSGGLDSLLVAGLVERAGLSAIFLHFNTGFQRNNTTRQLQRWAAGELDGISRVVTTEELQTSYLQNVVTPELERNGSRQPCVECRSFLLAEAKRYADARELHWIVTGDVVGQSHPSQGRAGFARIDQSAGVTGRVLRPLSGRYLDLPEGFPQPYAEHLAGSIQGRARRGQLEMAKRDGIVGVTPHQGGCCLLAEPRFRQRLRDDLEHEKSVEGGEVDCQAVTRLTVGRHFRLSWCVKIVVSRDAEEGEWIERDTAASARCRVATGVGSEVAVYGACDENQRRRVSQVAAHFSKQRGAEAVKVDWSDGRQEIVDSAPIEELDVSPIPPDPRPQEVAGFVAARCAAFDG